MIKQTSLLLELVAHVLALSCSYDEDTVSKSTNNNARRFVIHGFSLYSSLYSSLSLSLSLSLHFLSLSSSLTDFVRSSSLP